MREKLILWLKKFPLLYFFIQNFYWKILGLKAKILGTAFEEKRWVSRDLSEIRASFENLNHPHRQLLLKIISNLFPFSRILEIGCGYGPNLYLLARQFPKVELVGIDINPLSVQEGSKWLIKQGVSNVKLLVGKAEEISQFQDKSFDIVFTDAVLVCIGPDKINKIATEMFRIAKKAIILVEWHIYNDKDIYDARTRTWKRNYLNLFKKFVPEEKISLIKIKKEIWRDKYWEKLGYIIEIIL